jgi:hypothetical protein
MSSYQIKHTVINSQEGSLCAAAVINIMAWPDISSAFWVARALWYFSLTLSMTSVVASAQQSTILGSMPTTSGSNVQPGNLDIVLCKILRDTRSTSQDVERGGKVRCRVKTIMLFVWQFPVMTMSYAWIMFLVALTLYVCTPLIQHALWGPGSKVISPSFLDRPIQHKTLRLIFYQIAVFYLISTTLVFFSFACCSQLASRPAAVLTEVTELCESVYPSKNQASSNEEDGSPPTEEPRLGLGTETVANDDTDSS